MAPLVSIKPTKQYISILLSFTVNNVLKRILAGVKSDLWLFITVVMFFSVLDRNMYTIKVHNIMCH